MDDDLKFKLIMAAVVLAGAGAALWYSKRQVGAAIDSVTETAKAVVPYVNPADSRNIVNQGVSAVGAAVTGNPNWNLGSAIFDMAHYADGVQMGMD